MTKVCKKCSIEQPISSFCKKRDRVDGYNTICKSCVSLWQQVHYNKPGIKQKRIKRQSSDEYQLYIRKFRLKTQYGLSLEQYQAMLTSQDDCCAICKTTVPGGRYSKYFAVDHDHKTKKVRELLCGRCNTVLGHANDNQQLLQQMIEYLEKHK